METFDCIVIGAGPAGVTAAAYLADAGAGVLLVDERPAIGGAASSRSGAEDDVAWLWPDRFYRLGALHQAVAQRAGRIAYRPSHRVGAIDGQDATIRSLADDTVATASAPCLLVATGAREIPPAFGLDPGRGVHGLSDPESLVEAMRERPGARVVVAGLGPLLWATAAHLAASRVRLAAVIDAAGRPTTLQALALLRQPGMVAQGLGWRRAVWSSRAPILRDSAVTATEGTGRLAAVTVAALDGGEPRRIEAEFLAIGYGVQPLCPLAPRGVRPGLVIAGDAERAAGFDAAVATGTLAAADVLRTLGRPVGPGLGAAIPAAEAELRALRPFLWALERWWSVPEALRPMLPDRQPGDQRDW
ncbi:MAG: FAD-dependent oxidoreductase [Rhodospirillales bacterium]|nr:FAD-dependent oxidoreductase [Rhodospirillales bacterium]